MTVGEDDGLVGSGSVDLAIRLGFLALVGYWSFRVIAPFATILLWSAILSVALYPLFEWLRRRVRPGLAAGLITLLCLIVVVGPVTWLGLGMVSGIGTLVTELNSGHISLPRPPEYVKSWPVVGERLHQLWSLAVSNLKAALTEVLPLVKPVGGKLLEIAEGAFLGLLELLLSIVIAGFLFSRGPQMADALSVVLGRALSLRGKELVQVSGRYGTQHITWRDRHRASAGRPRWGGLSSCGCACSQRIRVCRFSPGHPSDRTSNLVYTDRHLELDGDGAYICADVHSLYDPRRLDRQRPETPFDGTWVDPSNACHLDRSHRGHDSVRNCWPVLLASRSLCCMGRVSRLAARSGSSRECSRASARAGLIHLLIAAQAIVGEPHSQRRLGCVAEKLSQRSVVSSLSWLCSANVQQPL